MPSVSVIVPVYKVENVLHYCIDSILNQTYKDFELILVDDGSPDNSGKICDEYAKKDNRIKVIHKENGGVSSARNCGIDVASGKYICFVDSDDYVKEDYLKVLVGAKLKHLDCDNIWCCFETTFSYIGTDCEVSNTGTSAETNFYTTKDIMTLHEKWLDVNLFCKLYERYVIVNNGLSFNTQLSLGEDLMFNFQYLDCTNGKIYVEFKRLYSYVQGNISSLSQKYYCDMFSIYKTLNNTMYQYITKWNCDENQIKKYNSACFYKYEVVLKNTFSVMNRDSKKEKIKYNNLILKSVEFKKALNNSECYINSLYRLAYKSGKYRFVMLVDKLVQMKKGGKRICIL